MFESSLSRLDTALNESLSEMLLSAILDIGFQKSGFKELPGSSIKSQEELTSFLLIQV